MQLLWTTSLSIMNLLSNPPPVFAQSTSSSARSVHRNPPDPTGTRTVTVPRPAITPTPTGTRTVTVMVPPSGAPFDGPEIPPGYATGRFCPWCWHTVEPSTDPDECNFFIQQTDTLAEDPEHMPWAILDFNLTRLYAAGVTRWDTPVSVSLADNGIVQYTGNYFLVEQKKGALPPLFVFNNQRFEPLDSNWRTYPFVGAERISNARRVGFKCSRDIPCELRGDCTGKMVWERGDL